MYYYSVSYLLFQNGGVKGGDIFLTASEKPLNIFQLKTKIKDFKRKELKAGESLEVVIQSVNKIAKEIYDELLPPEM